MGFLLKMFERFIAAKFGGAVVLGESDSGSARRLMGEMGFGGFLNQLSKGLKLIDAIRMKQKPGKIMEGFN